MGELWIAEHLGLGTEVVVKFISAELSDRPDAAERFAREAAAAAKVNSPHVVKILDYGASPDGAPFIVMEKLEGRDLATYLADRGSLPPDAVALVVRQLAKALTKAHAARIVHRDIKPANVFVCESERELFVKLLDFGVAKTEAPGGSAATLTGICVGTPGYMSPEQIVASKQVDHRADLWSLGVLAFHCLTGRKPFDGETAGAVLLAIHTLAMPKPSRHVPSLPAAVDAWFERACAREPEQRFASASELANALSTALALSVDPIAADVQETCGAQPSPTLSVLPVEDVSLAPSSISNRREAPLRRSRSVLVASAFAAVALGGVAYAGVAARTPRSHESVPLTHANVEVLPARAPSPAPVVVAEVETVAASAREIKAPPLAPDVPPRPRRAAPRSPARVSAAPAPASRPSATASSPSPSTSTDVNDPSLFVMPDERR